MKSPLSIHHSIEIGNGDLEIYQGVSIDAKPVVEMKKGDSLVANFLRILMSFAGGIGIPSGAIGHYNAVTNTYHNPSVKAIPTNAASIGGGLTRITVPSSSSWSSADYIHVMGFTGDWDAINGVHTLVAKSSTTLDIAVDSSLFGAVDLTKSPFVIKAYNGTPRVNAQAFTNPKILLGLSLQAVDVDDQSLHNECWEGTGVNQLNYTGNNVTVPASNGTEVEMSVSTDVSNNSGASIAIKEAGIACYGTDGSSTDYIWTLIARDLLTVNIADGKTASVSYKITSALGAEGGLTRQFLDMLYQHMGSGADTDIRDIENVVQSEANNAGNFMMAGAGGNNIVYPSATGYQGQWIGPQIGTGNTAVTTDDYKLQTRIANGVGAGQMKYYGSVVENFLVGDTPGEATFDIVRFFENVSGGSIVINETGLYAARHSSDAAMVYCVARHVLAVPVTVNDGEVLKVTYRFKLTV